MTTNAILSNLLFEIASTELANLPSPQVWYTIPEVTDHGAIGESAPTRQVTHLQSTSHEYIGGLADGSEFTLTCNNIHVSPDILDIVKGYKGLKKYMRVTDKDITRSPNTTRTYSFDVVVTNWEFQGAVGEQGSVMFSFKISGGITRA